MRNLEELTNDVIDHYKNKFDGELIINSIEYKTKYVNDNHIPKLEEVYEIYGSFGLLTLDNITTWNIPNQFTSKKSFENAIKMLKIAVDGFMESAMIERHFIEISSDKRDVVNLLSTEITELSNENFETLIDYYVEREQYSNAAKYENLKKKHCE